MSFLSPLSSEIVKRGGQIDFFGSPFPVRIEQF